MPRVGVFFGTVTGTTRDVADAIQREFGPQASIYEITDTAALPPLTRFDLVILGASTWNIGEMDEWSEFFDHVGRAEAAETRFALFGLGDQREYPDRFADTMGRIYDRLRSIGAEIVGSTPVENAAFTASAAVVDNHFVGLVIDQENQPDLTPGRIRNWVGQLKSEIGNGAGPH